MFLKLKLPRTLIWVYQLLAVFLIIFTLFRCLTLLSFKPEHENLNGLFASFVLGLRYDLRWVGIVLLPLILSGLLPSFSPFYSAFNKKVWTWYLAIASFFILFFFAADFGCFSYNKTRLNASALNFAEDPAISAKMLWQSYPILWMAGGLLFSVFSLKYVFRALHVTVVNKTTGHNFPFQRKWFYISAVLFGWLIYGSFSSRPLQWNEAFEMNNSFKAYLALNPLQNFFATLQFRKPEYNEESARSYYPLMASWLSLTGKDFNYKREVVNPQVIPLQRPNVVLVVCESFSMYKSSMSGNPFHTTPFFDSLTHEGVFFNRCFTPHFSTARGLFAILTGIPDVQLSKFSTRNPEALNQHCIINSYKGYDKFYFLGGSAAFNNFEGLVKNIEGVQMRTQENISADKINVWGISDKDLFTAANKTFTRQTKPFFAVIQTADNHRPFTIPDSDTVAFKKIQLSDSSLKKYGFESNEELNSFRYTDYCFSHFIKEAARQKYFSNTIFIFIGDHGVSGNARAIYPPVWTEERLTEEHVPLLFYAPAFLKPAQMQRVVSQIDVLPSISGLCGIPYENTTLGRDVFHENINHGAFIIQHDEGRIAMITDSFYFKKNINFPDEKLVVLQAGYTLKPQELKAVQSKFSKLTTAYYETAKWMLLHNKK